MEAELQALVARLAALRVLPRSDALVVRALTDDLFFNALTERLKACGLELVEHPYAEHVCVRIRRELEQPVFGAEDHWLSNNLGLKRNEMALLVVIWALLILPKRSRQIERRDDAEMLRQGEMFASDKPLPTTGELNISIADATLLSDFGDKLGRKMGMQTGLGVLARHGFIERRDGRIYEGPLLDLVLDYNRMARRVLDGALADLFGQRLDEVIETAPEARVPDEDSDVQH